MRQRKKSRIEAFAHRLGEEAHRLSLLSTTLRELRRALNLLTRELLICVAVLIGIWHLVAETLWRLLSELWR